jgi:hypothetical protein
VELLSFLSLVSPSSSIGRPIPWLEHFTLGSKKERRKKEKITGRREREKVF